MFPSYRISDLGGPPHAAPSHLRVRIMSIDFQDYYKILGVKKTPAMKLFSGSTASLPASITRISTRQVMQRRNSNRSTKPMKCWVTRRSGRNTIRSAAVGTAALRAMVRRVARMYISASARETRASSVIFFKVCSAEVGISVKRMNCGAAGPVFAGAVTRKPASTSACTRPVTEHERT